MARTIRSLILVGLCLLLTRLALADDVATSFKDAAARGDAQERASSTSVYFAKVLMPYYGQKYASVLQSCFATVPKPDSRRFSFVAAIGPDGKIIKMYNDQETNIFLCMRRSLEKEVFPHPPVFPYYLHIEMNFSGESPSQDVPPLVVEPNKYSYTFGVPKAWEYNFDQAQARGALLAFFPSGGNFNESKNVIYVGEFDNLCGASCKGAASQAIANTIRDSKEVSPALQVSVERPLKTKDGGQALIRILTGTKDPRQENSGLRDKEALAFIEHDETVIVVVLTARDMKNWDQDYAAFQEIVSGHKFFNCSTPGLAVPCSQ